MVFRGFLSLSGEAIDVEEELGVTEKICNAVKSISCKRIDQKS